MGKITEEELGKITELRKKINEVVYALGEFQFQRISLDVAEENAKNTVKSLKEGEVKLLNDLKEKYGNVSINIETGEF